MNFNLKAKKERTFDAIVVGSGISGGWAAKELTEKGLKVLLLERGRKLNHITDYKGAANNPWDLKYRGSKSRALKKSYPIQSRCYGFNEDNYDFWVNDLENPYIEDKPFNWMRGYHLGGRSLMWGRQSYRWSEMDFESNAKDGHGVDWPIRYKDLAPWYDYVETFAGISGSLEGLEQLPDGKFLPPMELNCMEDHIGAALKKNWDDRRLIPGRVANLSELRAPQKKVGRTACQYRDRCHWGCPYGGYFSSLSATLPAAMATGNLTIRADAIVHQMIFDKDTKRATGVRIIDANTKESEEFYSKIIFLNASTMASAYILLNSKSDRFPNGFGNSSGVVGRYLMDHHYSIGAGGELEEDMDKYYVGRRPNGIYIPRFRNLPGKKQQKDYVRGFGYQGGAKRAGWWRGNGIEGFGKNLKEELTAPGPWYFWLGAWGEHLPHYDNKISLDTTQTDQWGLPILKVDC
ncbi:MAG TPA: GMC family oxidoreductase, partial [Saprospiraceae bacterium]|nr:GMC family oxidoreductase [Saprospiraceae bacterium]